MNKFGVAGILSCLVAMKSWSENETYIVGVP